MPPKLFHLEILLLDSRSPVVFDRTGNLRAGSSASVRLSWAKKSLDSEGLIGTACDTAFGPGLASVFGDAIWGDGALRLAGIGNRNTASSLMISIGEPVASRGFEGLSCVAGEVRFGLALVNTRELRGADGDLAYDGSIGLSSVTRETACDERGDRVLTVILAPLGGVEWEIGEVNDMMG
jgi:hypothetical protein